ncbi:response regulator [Ktedonosporobacter rubrisoli]|uniref:Response regulator n=2 Tax=Ktedonosporobacter rubrisoli TaxID=2509675 RepID=A0A4P6K207_KTERU|nr:response regulator [Ktedonosporobacter rubrisoli]
MVSVKHLNTQQKRESTMNTPTQNTRPATILVVENEASNRILIERVLSTRGYRCLSASNGREALNILDQEQVDLILTDLSMPVLDGYRATQLIRARPGLANVPIVAVTAFALNDEGEAAKQIGCTEYLTKPFKPRQLLEVVERLLQR